MYVTDPVSLVEVALRTMDLKANTVPNTYKNTPKHAHTRTHTHKCTLTPTPTHPHPPTHTNTHEHPPTPTHRHAHTLFLVLSRVHSCSDACALSHSLS